jgi:hypothetical protein
VAPDSERAERPAGALGQLAELLLYIIVEDHALAALPMHPV